MPVKKVHKKAETLPTKWFYEKKNMQYYRTS